MAAKPFQINVYAGTANTTTTPANTSITTTAIDGDSKINTNNNGQCMLVMFWDHASEVCPPEFVNDDEEQYLVECEASVRLDEPQMEGKAEFEEHSISTLSSESTWFSIWDGSDPYMDISYESLFTKREVLGAYERCMKRSLQMQEDGKNGIGLDEQGLPTDLWPIRSVVIRYRFRAVISISGPDGEGLATSEPSEAIEWRHQGVGVQKETKSKVNQIQPEVTGKMDVDAEMMQLEDEDDLEAMKDVEEALKEAASESRSRDIELTLSPKNTPTVSDLPAAQSAALTLPISSSSSSSSSSLTTQSETTTIKKSSSESSTSSEISTSKPSTSKITTSTSAAPSSTTTNTVAPSQSHTPQPSSQPPSSATPATPAPPSLPSLSPLLAPSSSLSLGSSLPPSLSVFAGPSLDDVFDFESLQPPPHHTFSSSWLNLEDAMAMDPSKHELRLDDEDDDVDNREEDLIGSNGVNKMGVTEQPRNILSVAVEAVVTGRYSDTQQRTPPNSYSQQQETDSVPASSTDGLSVEDVLKEMAKLAEEEAKVSAQTPVASASTVPVPSVPTASVPMIPEVASAIPNLASLEALVPVAAMPVDTPASLELAAVGVLEKELEALAEAVKATEVASQLATPAVSVSVPLVPISVSLTSEKRLSTEETSAATMTSTAPAAESAAVTTTSTCSSKVLQPPALAPPVASIEAPAASQKRKRKKGGGAEVTAGASNEAPRKRRTSVLPTRSTERHVKRVVYKEVDSDADMMEEDTKNVTGATATAASVEVSSGTPAPNEHVPIPDKKDDDPMILDSSIVENVKVALPLATESDNSGNVAQQASDRRLSLAGDTSVSASATKIKIKVRPYKPGWKRQQPHPAEIHSQEVLATAIDPLVVAQSQIVPVQSVGGNVFELTKTDSGKKEDVNADIMDIDVALTAVATCAATAGMLFYC
jgi:hypothetical protein